MDRPCRNAQRQWPTGRLRPRRLRNQRTRRKHPVLGHDSQVYQRVGFFREDLPVEEDVAFIESAAAVGYPVLVDPQLSYIHHGEPETFADFVKKTAWNNDYQRWLRNLARGDRGAWRAGRYWYGLMFAAGLLPAGVPALTLGALRSLLTAHKTESYHFLPQLLGMYLGYGGAMTAGLLGYGRDKRKRWRAQPGQDR